MKLGPSTGLRWWAAAAAGVTVGVTGWLLLRDLLEEGAGPPQLTLLRRRVTEMAGAGRVRVRYLGDGIVELVGRIDDSELVSRLLTEAASVAGVEVVVNRLWGSGGRVLEDPDRPIDGPSGPR